jgi:DNA-binding response OmpR family regulator
MNQQRIILIEDDATLANVLRQKLEHEGYAVLHASDGRSGIDMVRKNPPDMVLLDIMMPLMDGYQVLEELRKDQDPRVSGVPVIIVSNSGHPVEIDRALSFGIKDYFVKASFDPDQVLAKIRKHLGPGISAIPHAPAETPVVSSSVSATDVSPAEGVLKILIIEDDKFLRDLELAKLMKEGFAVSAAQDGEQGIAMASAEHPQIILLDILLPGIDGFEVLTRLKQDPKLAATKVIMLSNFGQREDIERAEKLGAVKFLIKANYTLDEIVEEVKQVAATL